MRDKFSIAFKVALAFPFGLALSLSYNYIMPPYYEERIKKHWLKCKY